MPAFAAAADFISGWPALLSRRDGTLHGAAEFFVHRNQLLARPLARTPARICQARCVANTPHCSPE
jgi:hypothetical protein